MVTKFHLPKVLKIRCIAEVNLKSPAYEYKYKMNNKQLALFWFPYKDCLKLAEGHAYLQN